MKRRTALLAATAGIGLRSFAQTVAQTGDDAPLQDLSWTDASRQRNLPLRLRLPAGSGPVPLVLFSHGLGGSVDAGSLWAEAWAQAGIATLHLQHPGSDRETARAGMRAFLAAISGEQLLNRCADVRFVLDELARRQATGEALLQRLRLDTLGLAGHSFGSHTTLAIAGQGYGRAGAQQLSDPRPRAFLALSPSPGDAGKAEPARSFGGITRPVLCATGSLDGDPILRMRGGDEQAALMAKRYNDGRWRQAVYDALPAGDKAELWLSGADHMTFGGQDVRRFPMLARQRLPAALEQEPRHRALIASVSTRWWQAQLLGDGAARAELAQAPAQLIPQDAWRRA